MMVSNQVGGDLASRGQAHFSETTMGRGAQTGFALHNGVRVLHTRAGNAHWGAQFGMPVRDADEPSVSVNHGVLRSVCDRWRDVACERAARAARDRETGGQ
jgi:hypothetical protein